jgi:hypothetical protein
MTFLTQIRKIRNFLVTSLFAVSLGGLFFIPARVLASTYGSGNYGSCAYGTSCPSSSNPTPTSTDIVLNDYSEFTTGSGKQLTISAGQVVYFDVTVDGQTVRKSITIVSVSDNCVDFTITLDTTKLNSELCVGDSKSYDVDGDNKDDIKITLNSIADGKANMTFKALLGASISEPSTNQPAATAKTVTKGQSKSWWLGLMVAIFLLVIGLIIFLLLRRRKRKDDNDLFGPPPTIPQTPLTPGPGSPPTFQPPPANPIEPVLPSPTSQPTSFNAPLPQAPPPNQPPAQSRTISEIQDLHLPKPPTSV